MSVFATTTWLVDTSVCCATQRDARTTAANPMITEITIIIMALGFFICLPL
jgi:hypothetical protein